MKARSISTCSATTGSPKLSWADISDEDVEELGWESQCREDAPHVQRESCEDPPTAAGAQRQRPAARGRQGGPAAAGGGVGATPSATTRARAAAQRGPLMNRRSPRAPRSWPTSPAGGRAGAPPLAPAPTGGRNAAGSFVVEVENIPVRLCNDACIEAMLQQAGLHDFVLGIELKKGGTESTGAATIEMSTWQAVVKCYHHFATSSWSTGSLKVRMGDSQRWGGQDANMFVQDTSGYAWPQRAEASWASTGCCYVAAVVPAFPYVNQHGGQGLCIHPGGLAVPVGHSGLRVPCA